MRFVLGSTVHAAIEAMVRARREAEAEGRSVPPADDEAIARATRRAYEQKLGALEFDAGVLALATGHVRTAWAMEDDAEIVEIERLVRVAYPHDGVEHRLVGRIDRLDRLPDGRFRIVDYKTGRASRKRLEPKDDDLQLSIYAMVLPALLEEDATVARSADELPAAVAEYRLTATGERGVIDVRDLRLDRAHRTIGRVIDGILAGRFEASGSERDRSALLDLLPV